MMPSDPAMLLSYINTLLRDRYESLEELCAAESADMEEVVRILGTIDYAYDKEANRFV